MNENGVLDNEELFEVARKLYPGPKVGHNTEFGNFKKHKDWKEVSPMLCSAILYQRKVRDWLKGSNRFCPPWKHMRTWINNRCWEMEFPEYESAQPPKKMNSSPANAKSRLCVWCNAPFTKMANGEPFCDICHAKWVLRRYFVGPRRNMEVG